MTWASDLVQHFKVGSVRKRNWNIEKVRKSKEWRDNSGLRWEYLVMKIDLAIKVTSKIRQKGEKPRGSYDDWGIYSCRKLFAWNNWRIQEWNG